MPSSCARPPEAFLRLVFAGTPEFAERALARLAAEGHDIALVLTQPDRPSGRGLHAVQSPVKRCAVAHGIDVFQPADLKEAASQSRIKAVGADALVVAAYGLILPKPLLMAGRLGAINIHASLLPRWRGAAPIQRALLAGDPQTGISIMQMDEGLDTGPVLAQRAVAIDPHEDAATLHGKLAALGAQLIVAVLEELVAGRARAVPQGQAGATYAPKIDKRETRLDWRRPAVELDRAVRAFHPALTTLNGELVRIWRGEVAAAVPGGPGTIRTAGGRLTVACGSDALQVLELQRAGARRLEASEFLRGRPLPPGALFE